MGERRGEGQGVLVAARAVLVLVAAAVLVGGLGGCALPMALPGGGGESLISGGRGEGLFGGRERRRRLVPRVTQRAPMFQTYDSQGSVESEGTPTDDDTWWLMVRGQF